MSVGPLPTRHARTSEGLSGRLLRSSAQSLSNLAARSSLSSSGRWHRSSGSSLRMCPMLISGVTCVKNTCCSGLGGTLHRTGSAKRLAATMGAGSDVPDTMPAAAFMTVSFSPATIARETSAVATSALPSLEVILAAALRPCLARPPGRRGRKSCETMSGSRWSGTGR